VIPPAKKMNEIVVKRVIVHEESAKRTPGSRWLIVLLLSSAASISCLVIGLLLTVLTGLGAFAPSRSVTFTAVVLLILSFGLLFLVGDCMDRIAAIEKRMRSEQLRQSGSQDER
jgi:hypothetical protein